MKKEKTIKPRAKTPPLTDKALEALRRSEQLFRRVFDEGPLGMCMVGPDLTFLRANTAFCTMLGYSERELRRLPPREIIHPDYRDEDQQAVNELMHGRRTAYKREKRYVRKDGTSVWGSSTITPVHDDAGSLLCLLSMVEDTTQRRAAEEELRNREKELELKTSAIQEADIALRVLLKNREEDRKILESIIEENISRLVLPHLERMKDSRLTESQKESIDTIGANLQSIVSPFLRKLSSLHTRLTPTETQVANLIKNGKTSKEIASLLGVSKRTVDSHRESIRAKFKLAKQKQNLTSYLRNLE